MTVALHPVPAGAGPALIDLSAHVRGDLDALVVRMGEAYRREVPEYAAMSPAQMAAEVLPVSRVLVTTFLECVLHDRALAASELRSFELAGRERLRLGLPLDAVLHAFRVAGREAWSALCEAVPAGQDRLLAELGARWMDCIDRSSSAMARAYLAASHDRLRDLDARRRELLEALLTATTPGEVAAVSLRHSTLLAGAYVPVLVTGVGVAAGIDTLLSAAPAGTLGGHRGDRVLLLVPHRLESPIARGDALSAWGRPAACGAALLEEVHSVEQLLLTAQAEGHSRGGFGPDDLLVEQLLLGNERVSDALRRRVVEALSARDPDGVVLATLRAYLACGSVPEVARAEHVHANTVSYRLGRVRELTGLDARVPAQSALLVLGLGLPT